MDLVALVSVITSGTVGLLGLAATFWNTQRTAKTAKENREQQRQAEAYLKVLSLAEAEALWLDERVYNFELDHDDLWDRELF